MSVIHHVLRSYAYLEQSVVFEVLFQVTVHWEDKFKSVARYPVNQAKQTNKKYIEILAY